MDADYTSEFANIGAKIDRRWRQEAFHADAFPSIAVEAAASMAEVDIESLLVQRYNRLDLSYRFSDFDLRIFENDRFRIEILYWLGGSTSIHQHAFSGAFKLLSGRSVHVEYGFERHHNISPDLRIGDLHVRNSEILESGSIRRIDGGSRFIHANFHLVRPTVTMVIRTHCETLIEPQFNYHYPYIAIDPFFLKDLRARQQRLVELIARTGRWNLMERAIDTIWPEPTLAEFFDILQLPAIIGDPVRLDRTLARVADRYPAFAGEMAATTREDLRREKGLLLFRRISGINQRFLVALLINLPNAESILHHLAAEFPGEAPAAVAAQLLASISAAGHLPAIPEAGVPNLIAVIEGRRQREELAELSPLLGEEVLQPLFFRTTQFQLRPAITDSTHPTVASVNRTLESVI
jgi:hypothetical protein